MKKILLATTALVALAGVTSAAADVSITGYTRFTYDDKDAGAEMDPDYNIWFKAEETSDTGLTYGGAVRLTPNNYDGDASSSRHYMYLQNELGRLTMGQHHGPAYTMSVGADWRGTVSAIGESSYNVFQGHTTPRMIYMSPNFGGAQLGYSVSEGSNYLGAETQMGLNYTYLIDNGHIKFGYGASDVGAISNTAAKMDSNEAGVEFKFGRFTASYLTFDREKSGTIETTTTYYDLYVPEPDGSGFESGLYCDPDRVKPLNDESPACQTRIRDKELYKALKLDGARVVPSEEIEVSNVMNKVKGNEIELAFAANDDLTLSVVKFKTETDDLDYGIQDYDRTTIGAKYTVAPGLTTSLAHSSIDNNGEDESAVRAQINFSF